MSDTFIDPRIGDAIVRLLEHTKGKQMHIALLVFETGESDDGDPNKETLSSPVVVTSLPEHAVDTVIIEFAEYLKSQPGYLVVEQNVRPDA